MAPTDVSTRVAVLEEKQATGSAWQREHTVECTRRYGDLTTDIRRVHSRIDQMHYSTMAAAGGAILTLVTVLVQALMHAHS